EGKKTEEKKMEEKKPDEKKEEKTETKNPIDDAKEANKAEESKDPPPPQEIVLRVYMHCEGCAKKVRKCLKGFEGVEDVLTDCKGHKVVVKGEKADPVKVLERVQKKSHRQVELLSPIPKPPPPEDEKKEEKEIAKPEEKKEEPPIITVILKAHMHCEACAQEIRKRILKMKGVENVEADLKNSQVAVKGIFDPQNLVDYVRKRTGKQAVIVKQEPEKKEEEKGKEEKKGDEGGDKAAKGGDEAAKEKKSGEREAAADGEGDGGKLADMKKNEFYYNYPQNYQIYPYPPGFELQSYEPQIFSDENPNACSVM
ncbi:Heavy metal-associated isoprenylated plant protein, partial [Actinidia chinensis var. chinensis]